MTALEHQFKTIILQIKFCVGLKMPNYINVTFYVLFSLF